MKTKYITIKRVPKILALCTGDVEGVCKFIKSDATVRVMLFTVDIPKKLLKGTGGRYKAVEHGLTVVRDLNKDIDDCIRTIPWHRVVSIKIDKTKYITKGKK